MSANRMLFIMAVLLSLAITLVLSGLVLLLLAPDAVGYVRESDARATLDEGEREIVVLRRTLDSSDAVATRAFELDADARTQLAALDATATWTIFDLTATAQDVAVTLDARRTATGAELDATADALLTSEWLGVQSSYDNIVLRATLEYEAALLAIQATGDADALAGTRQADALAAGGTAVALVGTQTAVAATAQGLDGRGTQVAQRETQSARDAAATATQAAVRNARQATEAVDAFSSTQAAFDIESTRVEQDYRGTQAALAAQSTELAAALVPGTPTVTGEAALTDGIPERVEGPRRRMEPEYGWAIHEMGGLRAAQDGASILDSAVDSTAFVLELSASPPDDGGTLEIALGETPVMRLSAGSDGSRTVTLLMPDQPARMTAFEGGLVRLESRDGRMVVSSDGVTLLEVAATLQTDTLRLTASEGWLIWVFGLTP